MISCATDANSDQWNFLASVACKIANYKHGIGNN
jgi:hypothetical protein